MSDIKLGKFLTEVSNWNWEEFAKAEHDKKYTTNESVIFALVRACAMQQMGAIRIALNRLDGKLKTPVKIETPKIFIQYPNAKILDEAPLPEDQDETRIIGMSEPEDLTEKSEVMIAHEESELPSLSLRQTLGKMADYPRDVPEAVVQYALETEQWLRDDGPEPPEKPLVKSVVAAHLLLLAQNRDVSALTEVFDQIDGKLMETIQIIGEDMHITSYAVVAPPGAYINDDGVVEFQAEQAQQIWADKLIKEKFKNGQPE